MFEAGEKMVRKDLNVFHIVQSLHKLKVAMSVLLEENTRERMRKIVLNYLDNQKLRTNDADQPHDNP
jgi:hypothetical protein